MPANGRALTGVLVAAVLVAGCGSSSKAASSSHPAGGGAATTAVPGAVTTALTIKSFSFHPSPATVRVGTTLTVTNQDDTTHTITADDHSFDTGDLAAGASKTVTFSKAGKFTYHCNIHNYMTGVIQVTG